MMMIRTTNRPARAGFFFWLSILGILAGLLAPAYGAGTIPYSLSQQIGSNGTPLSGCKFYVYQAGTVSTPQNAYKDIGLTLPHPNPIPCDASGRLPQFFLADGLIKIRLADKNGVTQVTADNIQVIGPSGGGGGGGSSIDATTILATGDLKARYGTGVLTGFVRANGRTIGSATSGATERANADCQTLFEYLWVQDANLTVSGGRGASANADWVANKSIALPDWRGRVVAGLDDMGSSSALRLASVMSSTTLGAAGGSQNQIIGQTNLPNVNFTVTDPGHQHQIGSGTGATALYFQPGPTAAPVVNNVSNTPSGFPVNYFTTRNATGITVNSGGLNTALTTTPPAMLATIYMKL